MGLNTEGYGRRRSAEFTVSTVTALSVHDGKVHTLTFGVGTRME